MNVDPDLFRWMMENLRVQVTVEGTLKAQQAAKAMIEHDSYCQEFLKVRLVVNGNNKVPVIKVARWLTGLGLKEAKDLVDANSWLDTTYDKVEAFSLDLKALHDQGVEVLYERRPK